MNKLNSSQNRIYESNKLSFISKSKYTTFTAQEDV